MGLKAIYVVLVSVLKTLRYYSRPPIVRRTRVQVYAQQLMHVKKCEWLFWMSDCMHILSDLEASLGLSMIVCMKMSPFRLGSHYHQTY